MASNRSLHFSGFHFYQIIRRHGFELLAFMALGLNHSLQNLFMKVRASLRGLKELTAGGRSVDNAIFKLDVCRKAANQLSCRLSPDCIFRMISPIHLACTAVVSAIRAGI